MNSTATLLTRITTYLGTAKAVMPGCTQGLVTPPACMHAHKHTHMGDKTHTYIHINIHIRRYEIEPSLLFSWYETIWYYSTQNNFKLLLRNLPDNGPIDLGMVLLRCCPGLLLGSCFAACQICLFVV